MTDTLTFTTADGNTLVMPGSVYAYEIFPGPFGIPPTQFVTRQGYQQTGVTEVEYHLNPRDFDIEFWRAPACDRQTYWTNRAELVDFFRPNRGGMLTFTVTQADGTARNLLVRANPGPQFAGAQSNDWFIRETLSFTAFDPIWFDSPATSQTLTASAATQLVFPIIFPIQFGAAGLLFSSAITYTGTWKSFPTITLTGPYTTVTIENTAVHAAIYLTVPILAGEQRILTLTPGAQTIVDGLGVNKFGDLGPLSDLVNFALQPAPTAPGGVQTLSIVMIGATNGVSAASISYSNKFIGI